MESEFDFREYSDRYDFRGGRVYRRTTGKLLVHHVNEGTGYQFYRLTRNDGVRVSISEALISGKVEKSGDWYFVSRTPPNTTSNTEFPAYAFDYTRRKVWRIGFKAPRRSYVEIKPNKVNKFRLADFKGDVVWKHFEDLFN